MATDAERDLAMVLLGLDSIEALTVDPGRGGIRKEKISAWSVAEHCHHAAIASGAIALAVRGILQGKGEDGPEPDASAREILEAGRIPRGVGVAPVALQPASNPDALTIRAAVTKARSRWHALLSLTEEIDACEVRLPHQHLGLLGAAEWVHFAATHTDHHLRIVDDIEDA